MAKRKYIVQDRWCELCSRPAALLVLTVGEPGLKPVCSEAHGEELIRQLVRFEDNPDE